MMHKTILRKRCFAILILLSLFFITLIGCTSERTVIVVYSPHGPDVLGDYERRFEEAYPEVDIQWLDMGSQEILHRLQAERNRPQADIWWGAPSTLFMQATREGLLEPYRPAWADAVAPAFKDEDDHWYGVFRTPLGIMYNTRGRTKDSLPSTWDGLLEPEWQGKIALRKPLPSGTMRTFIGAMITRADSEEAGFTWLRHLHANTGAYLESPQMLYDHMKRREDTISIWLLPDAVLQRERNGYPLDCVIPEETPVLCEGIAIVRGTRNEAWAKRFYEFVTSPESLAHQAHAYAKIPAREDIDPVSMPDWIRDLDIVVLDIDWEHFSENESVWCDRWEREVFRSG